MSDWDEREEETESDEFTYWFQPNPQCTRCYGWGYYREDGWPVHCSCGADCDSSCPACALEQMQRAEDEEGEGEQATPRSVRDELRNAYKQASDFDTELFNALFAALSMLEKQKARLAALESRESNLHVRLAALEAAQSAPASKVLYEGEASVLKDGVLLPTLEARIAMHGHKRVHIVVTAAEEDES